MGKRAYTPHPRKAELVTLILSLKDSGKSLRDIADILNAQGVAKLNGTTPWTFQNVYVMVKRDLSRPPVDSKGKKIDCSIEPWMFEPLPWTAPVDEHARRRQGDE